MSFTVHHTIEGKALFLIDEHLSLDLDWMRISVIEFQWVQTGFEFYWQDAKLTHPTAKDAQSKLSDFQDQNTVRCESKYAFSPVIGF